MALPAPSRQKNPLSTYCTDNVSPNSKYGGYTTLLDRPHFGVQFHPSSLHLDPDLLLYFEFKLLFGAMPRYVVVKRYM